ncbi:MAG: helix-turn-helix domain-containing protein [Chitinophagales bacterium]|nr:helix-turn-helix domain-containing protein [Chitinophagales bacterium]
MKQDEFAALLGLNRGNISNYERGENTPDVTFLIQLQDLTGINAKTLCYTEVLPEEIPVAPLSKPLENPRSNTEIHEPQKNYEVEGNLYNFHELVKRVEELDLKTKNLEKRVDKLKDK